LSAGACVGVDARLPTLGLRQDGVAYTDRLAVVVS
jgi:hypothetical protein